MGVFPKVSNQRFQTLKNNNSELLNFVIFEDRFKKDFDKIETILESFVNVETLVDVNDLSRLKEIQTLCKNIESTKKI